MPNICPHILNIATGFARKVLIILKFNKFKNIKHDVASEHRKFFVNTMKKVFSYCIAILFLLPFSACNQKFSSTGKKGTPKSTSSKKPNIIFVLADDLGYAELGSYGNTFNETPNLDKLAKQGIKFSHAYSAAPVCSPMRGSFMTGQFPARVGITDFLSPKSERYLEPEKYVTINEALSSAGYHTGLIGKWHLDTDFKENKGGPAKHGFDEVIGTETKYIADGDYFFPYDKNSTFAQGEENEFLTDRLAGEAVNFIQRNKEQPFFLYLSHYSVHTRLDAPQDLVEKYKKKFDAKYGPGEADKIFEKNNRHQANHLDNPYLAAMLERIDAGVGSIMAELEKQGIADNTLLIFSSDNGGANNGGLRMHKTWLYEGGIREPLVMRWPAQIKAGTTTDVPVSTIDFYPTFVDAAKGDRPDGHTLDGLSLVPLITAGKAPERDELYWHYPSETGNWKNRMASAVRKGDYKLLEFYEDGRLELFNLKKDPYEAHNLAKELPEKTQELYTLLKEWRVEVKAQEPVLKK